MQSKYSTTKIISLFVVIFLIGCTPKKDNTETKIETKSPNSEPVTSSKEENRKLTTEEIYDLRHMKEWYPKRILPPEFDFSVSVADKSIVELWLLRNEIFARKGYLFDDAILRGYFSQFDWYQPVFDVPGFEVELSTEEQEFVNKVITQEEQLVKGRYQEVSSHTMISMDHLYNRVQFSELPTPLLEQLTKTNFAIVPAKHEQLFHIYDKNHYQYIPSFITTDIYLQVIHKHFSTILRKIEEDKFIPVLTGLLESSSKASKDFEQKASNAENKKSAQWAMTYLNIAYSLLTDKELAGPKEMAQYQQDELTKIKNSEGQGSEFLASELIQYSQFTPRGNYTKSPELQRYFRCMKWLNTAPIFADDDTGLSAAIIIGSCIKNSAENLKSFNTINDVIKFIVGDEDNLSISHVIQLLSSDNVKNPFSLLTGEKLSQFRKKLEALDPDRIKPQMATSNGKEVLRPKILFTAGRYTFDAEILSRLVEVTQPTPRRPFPKGLDVFASLGSKEAENILLNEYNEAARWEGYPQRLSELQEQFSGYSDWNSNIYCKTMETINNLRASSENYPLFMKTPSWERKNLVTSLAAWSELKHDMILYAEQPSAAQAGEGGGPPPPQHIGYVEPNIAFWEKSLELIDLQEATLTKMGLMTDHIEAINRDLREIGNMLLSISHKELAGEQVSEKEFNQISWLGGAIEYLTIRIFRSGHLPEKERMVAVVADVFRNNNTYLEDATGLVDEIYVVAEINGKPYITRGAVFSYYEFTNNRPLTDEQWQQQLLDGKAPPRPEWVRSIMVKTSSLEAKGQYSLLGESF